MPYIKSYKELIVCQRSIELVKEIYFITSKFPKSELYGLTSQMRRAGVSIPSVIAEGYARNSPKEYIQFCSIAYGSALELETQSLIAEELGLVDNKDLKKLNNLLEEVIKMLNSMRFKMKNLNAKR